jgi:hypothetical protein
VTGAEDQFAARSPGLAVNSVSTFVIWPGLIVIAAGIFTRL